MKKVFLAVLLCVVSIYLLSIFSIAHSGRTDSKGGHWNHSTDEYHYHCGGYPEHQHNNGVCPYSSSTSSEGDDDTIWLVVLIASAAAWLVGLIFKEHADFMLLPYAIGIVGMIVSVIAFIV